MSGAWLVLFLAMWLVCIVLAILVLGLSRRIQWLESKMFASGSDDAHAEANDEIRKLLIGRQTAEHAVESGVVGAAGGIAGVVLFVSEQCGPCKALASDLSAKLASNDGKGLAQLLGARVTIITDQAGAFDGLGATAVIADPAQTIRDGFAVAGTPTGIALDDNGVIIDAAIANEFRDVEKLARAAQPAQLDVIVAA